MDSKVSETTESTRDLDALAHRLVMEKNGGDSKWGHYKTMDEAQNALFQVYQSCLDGFFSGIAKAMTGQDYSYVGFHLWAKNSRIWDYREPYIEEILGLFDIMVPDLMLVDSPTGPRVIYKLERRMQKEPVHALNVFLRYSYEFLNEWPVQDEPPNAKEMWQGHLNAVRWDSSTGEKIGYIYHSNFCPPTGLTKSIGFNSKAYIDGV